MNLDVFVLNCLYQGHVFLSTFTFFHNILRFHSFSNCDDKSADTMSLFLQFWISDDEAHQVTEPKNNKKSHWSLSPEMYSDTGLQNSEHGVMSQRHRAQPGLVWLLMTASWMK